MKNFKVIYLACICFFFFNTSYATEMRWRVSGQIFEYQTNEALPYVSVSLKSRADSSLITGTISDEQGMFEFNKIEKGDYFMEFSFMGFESHGIEQITFTEGAPQVNLGNIFMHPAAMLLDGVEVKSKMSSIGQMIDRQVINVERNPFSTGGTAIDALKLSPSVQVDGDGKIKLRGSSSFTVLINGKPTALSAEEVLKQTSANLISKIEVITNPSVKYSSEGGAGIINIILKKGVQKGFNGVVDAGLGIKAKNSGNIGLNLNREKISLSAGVEWRDHTKTALHDYFRDLKNSEGVHHAFMFQDRSIKDNSLGVRFGVDYNPNSKNNISYSFHTGYNSIEGDIESKTWAQKNYEEDENQRVNSFYILQKPKFFTNNLNYTRSLKKAGSQLSFSTFYSYIDYYLLTNQAQSIADEDFKVVDPTPYLQDILNDNNSHEVRLDADYTLPISRNTTLETGLSANRYLRFLDITYSEFDYDENAWSNHPDYTNKYDFDEAIYGAYGNINTEFYGISATVGLRMEYMDRILEQKTTNAGYTYDKINFFPGISLSKTIKEAHSVTLSLSNRINRPDEYMMNPFPEFEDEYFYSEGNPLLIPEIVRSLELGHRFVSEKYVLSTNLYFRQTTDKIEQRLTVGAEDKMHISFHNDARDRATGLELMGNYNAFPFWTINASTNFFQYNIEGNIYEQPFARDAFSWTAQIVNSINLKYATSLQIIGHYASKTVRSQGELSDYYFVDVALEKQFLDGRLSLNFQAKDIFQSLNYQLTTETGDLHLLADFKNESPIFLINVRYQFLDYKKKTKDVQTEFDM